MRALVGKGLLSAPAARHRLESINTVQGSDERFIVSMSGHVQEQLSSGLLPKAWLLTMYSESLAERVLHITTNCQLD